MRDLERMENVSYMEIVKLHGAPHRNLIIDAYNENLESRRFERVKYITFESEVVLEGRPGIRESSIEIFPVSIAEDKIKLYFREPVVVEVYYDEILNVKRARIRR